MTNLHGIRKTQVIANYLKQLLAARCSSDGQEVEIPDCCSLDFLEELNFCQVVVRQAIKNKRQLFTLLLFLTAIKMVQFSGKMTWSVVDYLNSLLEKGTHCTGMQAEVERSLHDRFPPNPMETIAAPCLVVDCDDVILLWFLPGLLASPRQVGAKCVIHGHFTFKII
jgi:hypothetical protein